MRGAIAAWVLLIGVADAQAPVQPQVQAPQNLLVVDLSVTSDYRFDGLSNSDRHAAVQGSFYLWLDVGDGARFAKALWQKAGVRVLPGAYMAVDTVAGDPSSNPGHRYVRIALVHDSLTIEAALERVAEFLKGAWTR